MLYIVQRPKTYTHRVGVSAKNGYFGMRNAQIMDYIGVIHGISFKKRQSFSVPQRTNAIWSQICAIRPSDGVTSKSN